MFKSAAKDLARLVEWLFPRRDRLYMGAYKKDKNGLRKSGRVKIAGEHQERRFSIAVP